MINLILLLFWITFVVIYYLEYKRKSNKDKRDFESLCVFRSALIMEFAKLAKILGESHRVSSDNSRDNERKLITEGTLRQASEISSKGEDQTFPVLKGVPKPAVSFGEES